MAMKKVLILGLAGTAFSQLDTTSSALPDPTAHAESTISFTVPPRTNTGAILGVPANSSAEYSRSSHMPINNYSNTSVTTVMGPSAAASFPAVTLTDMVKGSSETNINPTTSALVGGMGGEGWRTPKASSSATTTGKPVSNDGIVDGVSISLLLVFITTSALLQV